jgi:chromosome partitioning protein
MPVITIASHTGVTGKSTIALTLATNLMGFGAAGVTLIETDPDQPIAKWRAGTSASNISVVSASADDDLDDLIKQQARQAFTIVDQHTIKGVLPNIALNLADFVIVPSKKPAQDLDGILKISTYVNHLQKSMDRKGKVDLKVVFNHVVSADKSRIAVLASQLKAARISYFKTPVLRRNSVWPKVFSHQLALHELPPDVPGRDAVQSSFDILTKEVIDWIIHPDVQQRAA